MNSIANVLMLVVLVLSNLAAAAPARVGQIDAPTPQVTPTETLPPSTEVPTVMPTEAWTPEPTLSPTGTAPGGDAPTAESTQIPTETATETTTPEPSPTPVVQVTETPTSTATATVSPVIGLTLSSDPAFIFSGETVKVSWSVISDKKIEPAVVQFSLPKGIVLVEKVENGSFDETTRLLTVPAGNGTGEFALLAESLDGDVTLAASLINEKAVLATVTLLLPTYQQFNVGKRGGEVSALHDRVKISFPTDVLLEDAEVQVGEPLGKAQPAYSLSGRPFEITAHSLKDSSELRQFKKEIEISVSYDAAQYAGRESQLTLSWYNSKTQDWEALPGYVDRENHVLHAFTDHFTVFDIHVNSWEASRLPTIDAYQVSQFTGAATYSFPIEAPPGPGGLQPSLSLAYNSQVVDQSTTKTQASWVGMGWSMDVGSIEINGRGTDQWAGDDTYSLNVAGVGSTIVEFGSGLFHMTDENFWKIQFDDTTNIWTLRDKKGNTYYFGESGAYAYYRSNPNCGDMGKTPYRWMLTKVVNVYGQVLQYTYVKETKYPRILDESCHGVDSYDAVTSILPNTIVYPNNRYRMRYEWEARTDYKNSWKTDIGFHMFDTKRLKNLYVEQDADGNGTFETVIRRYYFQYYTSGTANVIFPGITWTAGGKTLTLKSVTQYGAGGTDALPATTFYYADNLHLTQAANGYGGAVEFTYTLWYYSGGSRRSQTGVDKFGRNTLPTYGYLVGVNSCRFGPGSGTWTKFTPTSSVDCADNGGSPDELLVRGTGTNTGIGLDVLRPGGVYKLVASGVANDPGVTTKVGLYNGSTSTYASGTSGIFTLPVTATKADPLIQTSGGNGYAHVTAFVYRLLPSFYRVTTKTLSNGEGASYAYTYAYTGPAVNTDSMLTCDDSVANADCHEYVEKYSSFIGHATVTETGPDGRMTVTDFNQDDALKGRPSQTIVKTASTVFSTTLYTYAVDILPITPLIVEGCHVGDCAYYGLMRYWVRVTSDETRIGDTNNYSAVKHTYTYNSAHGFRTQTLTQYAPYGTYTPNPTSWTDYTWEMTAYHPASNGLFLVEFPARQAVYQCNASPCSANNTLVSVSDSLYDGSLDQSTPPSAGKLTATRNWVDSTHYVQADYGNDTWGNRCTVTTYDAVTTYDVSSTSGSTPGGTARTTTTNYDANYHTYAISVTNPLNQTTSMTYDYTKSVPLSETDPNNAAASAAYDAFGRMTALYRPDPLTGSPVTTASLSMAYQDAYPFTTTITQQVDATTTFSLTRRYDGMGRQKQINTQGILVDYGYDAYGRVASQSTPHASGETAYFTTTTYDILGRPLTVTAPDGTAANYAYTAYNTTVTDAAGHPTTTTVDALGHTVSIAPPAGPGVSYTYDVLDRLLTATRAGNTASLAYDWLGRKLTMSDPDMGSWTYTYDPAGSLLTQTDARGCQLSMTYDVLSRLTNKSSSGAGCGTQLNVTYSYDAGINGKGRRTNMTDDSGSTVWAYDKRGRMTSETKTITGTPPFTTGWTYNSADLPISMTYPDGEVVTTAYNSQMLLNSLGGTNTYVSSTAYDSAGRMRTRLLGSGLTQTYTYNSWNVQGGRLQSRVTGALQNLSYQYDAVGNVRTITDALAGETHTYDYDALDRLTSWTLNGAQQEAYDYDPATGNLASKAGLAFSYNASQPHAVSAAGGNTYTYDTNGNQVSRIVNGQTFTLFYDAENRLAAVDGPPLPTTTPTATLTATVTSTPTTTATPTGTATGTPTSAVTNTPTTTATLTGTATKTPTSTATATGIVAATSTRTPTGTVTSTITNTPVYTPTFPPTASPTSSVPVFTVSKTQDTNDGVCDADCSLREAIIAANANPGADIIILPAGTYVLSISGSDDNALTGDLDITAPLTISGSGAFTTIITGGSGWSERIFQVITTTLTLQNLTVQNGNRTGSSGGAIRATNSSLILDGLVLKNNHSSLSGGAIYSDTGSLTMTNSAVVDNLSDTDGGGIYNTGGSMSLTNVTISGNSTAGNGGGIRNGGSGQLDLVNVTISNNIADNNSDGVGDGGGLYRSSGSFTTNIKNTMIAGNADHSSTTVAPDCNGTITSLGHNLIGNNANCSITAATGDLFGTPGSPINPLLGILADNGGSTLTHALQTGSPAINAGDNAGCPAKDQRGYNRDASCDMGAYESGAMAYAPAESQSIALVRYVVPGNNYFLSRSDYAPNTVIQASAAASATQIATFTYDGDGKQVKSVINGVTTYFVGGYYQRTTNGTTTTETKYYFAGSQRIAMRANGTLTYLLGDHLGSTSIVTNASGVKISEQRYKPWGETRSGSLPTKYQYTGQRSEMDSLALYFYQARWYDPYNTHFISPDSIIPDNYNTLDWDRYAYARSNPLKYNDPSGHAAIGDTSEAGCSGQGPSCIIDMYSGYGDYEGMDDSLRHYVRDHPDYNPFADTKLDDVGRSQLSIVMFQSSADEVSKIPNFWDRTKAAINALLNNLAPVALTAIIVTGTDASNDDGSSDVLQYGGHTIKDSTLSGLNLTKSDSEAVHAALRDIRKEYGLPNNFHGNILANGDYVNPQTGTVLGNIFNYLP